MIKKAFNLSEILISIATIGIVAALIIPLINFVNPHRDRIMYKKAAYSLTKAVSAVMETNSTVAGSSNGLKEIQGAGLCNAVCQQMNVLGSCNCASAGSYGTPNFKTLDGLRFWGLTASFTTDNTNGDYIDVYVDYTLSKQDKAARQQNKGNTNNDLRLRLRKTGKVGTESSGFTYENKLLNDQDSLE